MPCDTRSVLRNIQDRPFETKTKTKTRKNRSRVLSIPRPRSRGLHPWRFQWTTQRNVYNSWSRVVLLPLKGYQWRSRCQHSACWRAVKMFTGGYGKAKCTVGGRVSAAKVVAYGILQRRCLFCERPARWRIWATHLGHVTQMWEMCHTARRSASRVYLFLRSRFSFSWLNLWKY